MADSMQFRRGLRNTVKPLPIGMPGFIEDEERLVIGKGDGTNTELPNKADIDNINSQMADIKNNYFINPKFPPAPIVQAKGDGTTNDSASINGCLSFYLNVVVVAYIFQTEHI
jgi:hypothetical protein